MSAQPDSETRPVELVADQKTSNRIASEDQFSRLAPSAIRLWRIQSLLVCGSIWLAAVCGLSALWVFTPVPPVLISSFFVAVTFYAGFDILWYPPRRYRGWSYRLGTETVDLRQGVFWHSFVLIPLTRIQHVDVHQNLLERQLGLATLEVHTAGTRNASHSLPGLNWDSALELRDRIVAASLSTPDSNEPSFAAPERTAEDRTAEDSVSGELNEFTPEDATENTADE